MGDGKVGALTPPINPEPELPIAPEPELPELMPLPEPMPELMPEPMPELMPEPDFGDLDGGFDSMDMDMDLGGFD